MQGSGDPVGSTSWGPIVSCSARGLPEEKVHLAPALALLLEPAFALVLAPGTRHPLPVTWYLVLGP